MEKGRELYGVVRIMMECFGMRNLAVKLGNAQPDHELRFGLYQVCKV